MSKRRTPTDAELAILRVLWMRGPSTVREITSTMGRERGYTTVLKFLQIMIDKRLVRRNESKQAHVYRAAVSENQTQRQLVRDLLARAFDGSPSRLVMQALATSKASPEELAEIEALLTKARGGPR
ncbi:MAG: BlaI/MecI/CopY family transcriptional regulator [Vicinamibacterales bacterium]|jgi:predicted transcriptional regulator|nr:BlaI/MecI/CopY family transcriptional regulator [Vicinamibacterales bacterium]